jgi:hypothetical protein
MKPRLRKPFGMLAVTLLLPACATVSTPEYPRQHPANPDALQAPAPTASSALDTYRPAPARKDQSGLRAVPEEPSGHAGHGNSAQEPADELKEHDHEHH